jgi:hypothetical protein
VIPLGTLERIGAGIGVKRVPTLPEKFLPKRNQVKVWWAGLTG